MRKDKSNMRYVYFTWGGQKNTRTRRRLPVRKCSKKKDDSWQISFFLCGYMRRWAFFLFSDGLQKVYDSFWIELDLISWGKLWRIDHRVVTLQHPDKIIVLLRIWSLRLILSLTLRLLLWACKIFNIILRNYEDLESLCKCLLQRTSSGKFSTIYLSQKR